jgi:hypothetical protein
MIPAIHHKKSASCSDGIGNELSKNRMQLKRRIKEEEEEAAAAAKDEGVKLEMR